MILEAVLLQLVPTRHPDARLRQTLANPAEMLALSQNHDVGTSIVYSFDRALAEVLRNYSPATNVAALQQAASLIEDAEKAAETLISRREQDTREYRKAQLALVSIWLHRSFVEEKSEDDRIDETYEKILTTLRAGFEDGLTHLRLDEVRARTAVRAAWRALARKDDSKAKALAEEAISAIEQGETLHDAAIRISSEATEILQRVRDRALPLPG